jgi:NAD(P)-dependent dehydrogenase (short-subunit alcohol dehydrogenase family)
MSDAQQEPGSPPPQHQDEQPGREEAMVPEPDYEPRHACGRMEGRVALITGGDSGIGRAVAVAFAAEGADVVIVYLDEHDDAAETRRLVEGRGRRCLTLPADLGQASAAAAVIARTIQEFGRLDVLVNNAAEQHPQESIEDISEEQLERTFRTNIYAMFFLTKAALPHLEEGAAIVNTTSVTAYKGNPTLLDYSSTKGAIVSFTRSLAMSLVEKGIRVNAVAPGPIWTPLIPSTFEEEKVGEFGQNAPLGRVGQPVEVASAYVFLASDDASYMTGQVLHPNGGTVVNG